MTVNSSIHDNPVDEWKAIKYLNYIYISVGKLGFIPPQCNITNNYQTYRNILIGQKKPKFVSEIN